MKRRVGFPSWSWAGWIYPPQARIDAGHYPHGNFRKLSYYHFPDFNATTIKFLTGVPERPKPEPWHVEMLPHSSDPEPPEDHPQFILSVPEPICSTLLCFWTSRAKVVVDRHPIYPNTDPSTANLCYVRGAGGCAKGRIDLHAA
jgi:hypothetical protein